MFQLMSAQRAVQSIPDGAWIGLNAFLALSSPFALHDALMKRFMETGHPKDLSVYCPSGFGCWDEAHNADQYAAQGAVKRVVTSHFSSMPAINRLVMEGKIEGYCLPLGIMSQSLRAAAAGQKRYLSKVGLNLFVDPAIGGAKVLPPDDGEWVRRAELDGEDYLSYKTPELGFALIKGTSVDPAGNICFDDECVTNDALALAQAVKRRKGTVLVQVERVNHTYERPRNVILPGILVDGVVVCEEEPFEGAFRAMSGGIHVPESQMSYWMGRVQKSAKGRVQKADPAHRIIGERAARELVPGQVVNIGIGIPEMVGKIASESGILRDLVLTVESGGIGGLPTPGAIFGAMLGADCIVDMAQQFDFYDGGGLDICFMGALEVDEMGNVNAHRLPGKMIGIGGFANITGATKTVVFCLTLTAGGLEVERDEDGRVAIRREGRVAKLKKQVSHISFSAKNALNNGQTILYVTERCVFRLTEAGLKLVEVYDGIDVQKQIIDKMEFLPIK